MNLGLAILVALNAVVMCGGANYNTPYNSSDILGI